MTTGEAGLDVAILTPAYWPEVRRGTERFAHELARGLAGSGHRPRVLTSHRGGFARDVEDGLEVLRVPRPPEGQLIRRGMESHLTHVPIAYLVLRLIGPDVAHALYAADGVATARYSRVTGRPSVFSYMGIPDRPWLLNSRMRLKTTLQAAEGAAAVVALSKVAADEFHRTLGIEARVIPPGVDMESFTPGGERTPEPTVFCAAAVNAHHKRVGDLIAAMPRVRRERPGARLLLSRPPDPDLAARTQDSEGGVELIDVDDTAALRDAYRSAWVTALPSIAEAFGLVLVESLACGTPVVGRRHSAIPEVIDDDTIGTLFDGGPDELSVALLETLDHVRDPKVPGLCRERAQRFSTDRCTAAYEALYRELLAR